jgi:hypothetical protein
MSFLPLTSLSIIPLSMALQPVGHDHIWLHIIGYQPPRTPATKLASGLSHHSPLPFPNDEHQQLFECNFSDLF